MSQEVQDLRRKYQERISSEGMKTVTPGSHEHDQRQTRRGDAMAELLNEWDPVGHTVDEVRFVVGIPGQLKEDSLLYYFLTNYGGKAWEFKLEGGKVVEVEQLPIL